MLFDFQTEKIICLKESDSQVVVSLERRQKYLKAIEVAGFIFFPVCFLGSPLKTCVVKPTEGMMFIMAPVLSCRVRRHRQASVPDSLV